MSVNNKLPVGVVGEDVAHRVGGAPRRRVVVVSVALEGESAVACPARARRPRMGAPRWVSRERQLCWSPWKRIGGSPARSRSGLKRLFTTFWASTGAPFDYEQATMEEVAVA